MLYSMRKQKIGEIPPKKYLSVFFIEASLDFIKDKMLFGEIYIFSAQKGYDNLGPVK